MKLLLKILGGLAALIVLLALVSFFFPRTYRVERSLVIKARPEAIHAQVADLKAWKSWGAWQERDPGMKMEYSAQSTGVGAWSAWQSAKEGNGKMTITALTPTAIAYGLEFPDFGTKSNGKIALTPEAAGTRVVWTDEGDLGMNPMNRWFGLFIEGMIGPDFDRGLANIAKKVEGK